jgi:ankyrin repeat protein
VAEQHHMDCSDEICLVATLLDHGAAVDRRGTAGGTPLFYILQKYDLQSPAGQMVLRLIQHGADVRAKDDNGRCPLDSIRNELGHEDYKSYFYDKLSGTDDWIRGTSDTDIMIFLLPRSSTYTHLRI